ncbi:MAG: ethanolamine permease [Azospira oryzae]|nr:MAG: ethanolamine permease [Azospira oryzae]
MSAPASSLRKVLKPVHLWAIAVGLVISGEYFGWNFGWEVAGTGGFLVATLVVTLLYITFIFSFTELTTLIPHAGGPFAYAHRAFGEWGGFIAGYATLIEFLFTTPAIAFALGSYTHFLYPSLPVLTVAYSCYLVFTLINLLGIKESATFSLIITILAVLELLVFIGIAAPHFEYKNFTADAFPSGWSGVFAALPFAIWFYLAIEGVAMVAEEVENPKRDIPKGYLYGLLTLVVLALAVMMVTAGIGDWHLLSRIDYPLPEALRMIFGKDNPLTQLFASVGLFGLIASFHGTIITYSRQLFALARSGYVPGFLAQINQRFQTPHWSLTVGAVIGCIALSTGTTDQLILIAVLGAVVMYMISMLSLFVLRKKESLLIRPFKAPFYPYFPFIALVLSSVCLVAIVYYNPFISLLFLIGLLFSAFLFYIIRKNTTAKHIAIDPNEVN